MNFRLVEFPCYSSGPPEPVFNCTVSNHSSDAFLIACQPGFHGGLPQNFSLHFFEESNSSGRLVIHQIFAEPIFLLSSLKTNMRYKASIASINAKGKSDDVIVEISTQKEPERQLEVKPGKSTGPITFSYFFLSPLIPTKSFFLFFSIDLLRPYYVY